MKSLALWIRLREVEEGPLAEGRVTYRKLETKKQVVFVQNRQRVDYRSSTGERGAYQKERLWSYSEREIRRTSYSDIKVQKTGSLSTFTISGAPEMFGTSEDLAEEWSSSNSTSSWILPQKKNPKFRKSLKGINKSNKQRTGLVLGLGKWDSEQLKTCSWGLPWWSSG